ncbi:HTR-like protein, partial [Shigella sonnei]|nr:HTR-like protein [Shigella sonnei]
RYPELPFILYTGQGSEAVAKQAILDDATDYVEKDVGREQYEVLAERIRKAVRP